MATLTASAAASGRSPRAVHAGVNSLTVRYNSGSTEISPSATTIYMAKIPHGATIIDVIDYHTAGSATCPADIGVVGSLAEFVSAATLGAVTRAALGVPYTVSVSADTAQYRVVTATVTPGTATASVKINLTVLYTMDE